MSTPYSRIFHRRFESLEPIPTNVKPAQAKLNSIRAVLFELYGTLFISGGGDLVTSREAADERALAEVFKIIGIPPKGISAPALAKEALQRYFAAIDEIRGEAAAGGTDAPAIDVVKLWQRVLRELGESDLLQKKPKEGQNNAPEVKLLAAEYAARVNPCWPMPGMVRCLTALVRRGFLLGIVSNAQFYSRDLFPALLGKQAEEMGFDPTLEFYSYQCGFAKPSLRFFQSVVERLAEMSVKPAETLYVGSDLFNDILPAARAGFRTALFAGDARSFKPRNNDPRAAGIKPDLILTSLGQIDGCIVKKA